MEMKKQKISIVARVNTTSYFPINKLLSLAAMGRGHPQVEDTLLHLTVLQLLKTAYHMPRMPTKARNVP